MKSKIARLLLKKRKENKSSFETDILIKSAARSSNFAIRESKALDLPIKFIEDQKIIEKLPNGEVKILRELQNKTTVQKGLKKGMVLCRK